MIQERQATHPNRRKITKISQNGDVIIADIEHDDIEEGVTQGNEGTPVTAAFLNGLVKKSDLTPMYAHHIYATFTSGASVIVGSCTLISPFATTIRTLADLYSASQQADAIFGYANNIAFTGYANEDGHHLQVGFAHMPNANVITFGIKYISGIFAWVECEWYVTSITPSIGDRVVRII